MQSLKAWFAQHAWKDWNLIEFWKQAQSEFECHVCQRERQRRRRVMHGQTSCGMTMDEAQVILNSRRFEESVLITEYNKPVTLYA